MGLERTIRELYDRACEAFQADHLPIAEQLCQQILELNPRHGDSLNLLGFIAYRTGNTDVTIQLLNRAIKADGNIHYYHNNLGALLKTCNRTDEAILEYRKAIAVRPDYVEAHDNLGVALRAQNRIDEAIVEHQIAIEINPSHAPAHLNLGSAFMEKGKTENSIYHLRHYLELDPSDGGGARILLAKLGADKLPGQASEGYLKKMYSITAKTWDNAVSYKGHLLVADAFEILCTKNSNRLRALDLGCGTGLVGELIRDKVEWLEGVDLSPAMLEKAKHKKVYDKLHQQDLVSFLSQSGKKYDLITCAATLIHFGDLTNVFGLIVNASNLRSLFIGTLFVNDEESDIAPHALYAEASCYSHGLGYLERLATKNGFKIEILRTELHEQYEGQPVMGIIFALRYLGNTAI